MSADEGTKTARFGKLTSDRLRSEEIVLYKFHFVVMALFLHHVNYRR